MIVRKKLSIGIIVLVSALSAAVVAQAEQPEFSDAVRKESQNNIDYLAAKALGKAKTLLNRYGDFAPFGAGLLRDGTVKHVWAVKPGEKLDNINPMLVLNSVRTALTEQSRTGRLLGSAVIYKYRSKESDDPRINIELEYVTGYAKVLSTAFSKTESGEYEFGSSVQQKMDPVVFKHLVDK